MLCVVVLPVGRSVVLVSRRVCLLRKRSVLESEEGIIVYSNTSVSVDLRIMVASLVNL